MHFKVTLATFEIEQQGMLEKSVPGALLFQVSRRPDALGRVADLARAEYGQAVFVDRMNRMIRFGRDYLGHFPLLFAATDTCLFISDDMSWIVGQLRESACAPTLSEESLALYFAMGYVPCGKSAYRDVVACLPHTVYEWRNGAITESSTFRPIEVDPQASLSDLEEAIEREVAECAKESAGIDVWCSGGLDSSIMAQRFNDDGRKARLITLAYGDEIHRKYGDGERGYAHQVAESCGASILDVGLTAQRFGEVHDAFVATHHMPIFDVCVPAKYALAAASGNYVITGEGSDPLFAGPKNNMMLYALQRNPALSLGWLYAIAHNRLALRITDIFTRGAELTGYVSDFLDGMFDRYPGDLLRKLFYLNIHVKAASLIYTESYFAGRQKGISVRHPYSALAVYEAAFRLEVHHTYRFPKDKLALKAIYGGRIPDAIVNRKKSGTIMPLGLYLQAMPNERFGYENLEESGLFKPEFLEKMRKAEQRAADPHVTYALVTLDQWLKHKGELHHANRLSPQARHHQQRRAAVTV